MTHDLTRAASAFGRLGGEARSPEKAKAARANGARGGHPLGTVGDRDIAVGRAPHRLHVHVIREARPDGQRWVVKADRTTIPHLIGREYRQIRQVRSAAVDAMIRGARARRET